MRAKTLVNRLLETDPDAVDPRHYLLTTPPWWENLDEFTKSYIDAALWTTNDESEPSGGEPLNRNYSAKDIAPETLKKMAEDCANFQRENAQDLAQTRVPDGADWNAAQQGGTDFWLSRNGHGAGFFDAHNDIPYPDDAAERLQDAARSYGTFDLYVGDDQKIYHF